MILYLVSFCLSGEWWAIVKKRKDWSRFSHHAFRDHLQHIGSFCFLHCLQRATHGAGKMSHLFLISEHQIVRSCCYSDIVLFLWPPASPGTSLTNHLIFKSKPKCCRPYTSSVFAQGADRPHDTRPVHTTKQQSVSNWDADCCVPRT